MVFNHYPSVMNFWIIESIKCSLSLPIEYLDLDIKSVNLSAIHRYSDMPTICEAMTTIRVYRDVKHSISYSDRACLTTSQRHIPI